LRLWVAATARSAAALLAAAFPRSAAAGELGEGLEARLRRQLRLWCTGARAAAARVPRSEARVD
jgi:hypothetical protein